MIEQYRLSTLEERARAEKFKARVAELESEVMPMREAFGQCRSMLRLSDLADIGSVVRSVSDACDGRYAAESEVVWLEGLLKISADTNAKLIARLGKEVGA